MIHRRHNRNQATLPGVAGLLMLAAFLAIPAGLSAASDDPPALLFSTVPGARNTPGSCEPVLVLPGDNNLDVKLKGAEWTDLESIRFTVHWPENAPSNAQALVYMKDWDHFWYQTLIPGYLDPGEANFVSVDLGPKSADQWTTHGHYATWHFRALLKPKLFGIRIFAPDEYEGACTITDATGVLRTDDSAPVIRSVRANSHQVACYETFELSASLPDRYADPFDAEEVLFQGTFTAPDGTQTTIDGFYGRDFFRKVEATGEDILPQGTPYWRVRYTPLVPGPHSYTLKVKDEHGEAEWGPATFVASEPKTPGFVRVSKRDPRYLEHTNGDFFFPVGHNIRSPNDLRIEKNFPWMKRWPEGSASYVRRFADMKRHGENFAEIWSASWSLGLEWHADWKGYRGIGQYNMMHAWEFDRLLEEATRQGIYIGLVIHNHGKFSTFCDPEWDSNPFSTQNGGYLASPNGYFTDPKALAHFRKLMRYMVSRWSHSPNLVSWQLWSELDLAGAKKDWYKSPAVVDWHRIMGREVKLMDPYDHLVATHTCGDYTHQNEDIISLPEIDFCPCDAYHASPDPLHIVTLMQQTVTFNNAFEKPVLITEFGGTAMAQGLQYLVDALHAALWTSTCTPIAGTPLFWWWHLIEEEELYPMFASVSRFMEGEDRRNPKLVSHPATVRQKNAISPTLGVQCMSDGVEAVGWLYDKPRFSHIDPEGEPTYKDVVLSIPKMADATFRAEFWDTTAGLPIHSTNVTTKGAVLLVPVPPFSRDIAFKVRLARQ